MSRLLQDDDLRRLAEGIAQGLSCRDIAAQLGVSPATAIRWTKRLGLTSRRSRRLAPQTRESVRALIDAGASPAQAAARCGVSLRTAARLADPARASRRRARLVEDVRGGATLAQAAARAGVSEATAARWTLGLPRPRGRRRDEAPALAALERGMSAATAAAAFSLDQEAIARLLRRPRLAPERLARRERLFAALAAGLSRRKAAAAVGLPIATAIRWARSR